MSAVSTTHVPALRDSASIYGVMHPCVNVNIVRVRVVKNIETRLV